MAPAYSTSCNLEIGSLFTHIAQRGHDNNNNTRGKSYLTIQVHFTDFNNTSKRLENV